MGTHLRVLSEGYLMNKYQNGLDGFQNSLLPYALDQSSISIGRVKTFFK